MSDYSWIYNLKKEVPDFLAKLKGIKRPGFYHYSLSGDLFGENIKWGLGNAVFFLKIIYTLGLEDHYRAEIAAVIGFVKSFQKKNGEISDPLVNLLASPGRFLAALRNWDNEEIFGAETKRAETRQAFSALELFGAKPEYGYRNIPRDRAAVGEYLARLDWTVPWGAGSHFSHLLFFLKRGDLPDREELITFAIEWVNGLQHPENGFWYQGEPEISQKINGAMKIISGLIAADRVDFKFADKIIDNCLAAKNDRHACDNFNIVYALKYCRQVLRSDYRAEEIREFMIDRLAIYRKYYHAEAGGFSFNPTRPKKTYYGAFIDRGLPEPDIHGTVLFLWGIAVIAQVLGIDSELGFREFIT
ncbi:MAG TPA: hypothetical protein VMC41_04245 [Candidatus Nanoarchaeia archaeon]|nr:hypothetical protein [Candidatus Nanoarchaeia archaeon]